MSARLSRQHRFHFASSEEWWAQVCVILYDTWPDTSQAANLVSDFHVILQCQELSDMVALQLRLERSLSLSQAS